MAKRKPKPPKPDGSIRWRITPREIGKTLLTGLGAFVVGAANLATEDNISAILHQPGRIAAGVAALASVAHFFVLLIRDNSDPPCAVPPSSTPPTAKT